MSDALAVISFVGVWIALAIYVGLSAVADAIRQPKRYLITLPPKIIIGTDQDD